MQVCTLNIFEWWSASRFLIGTNFVLFLMNDSLHFNDIIEIIWDRLHKIILDHIQSVLFFLGDNQTYLIKKDNGMLGRHAIAMPVPVQLHVVGGPLSYADGAVPHRGGLRKPLGDRRAVAEKAGVVPDVRRIDLRRPDVVEVLGNDGTQHGARPQRRFRLGPFPGAGEDARYAVDVRGRQQLARQRHYVLVLEGKEGV